MQTKNYRLRWLKKRHQGRTGVEPVTPTFVSIHVRRADYEAHLQHWYSLDLVGDDYFVKAKKYFSDQFEVRIPFPYLYSGRTRKSIRSSGSRTQNIRIKSYQSSCPKFDYFCSQMQFQDVIFYVVSDDPIWAKPYFETSAASDGKTFYVGGQQSVDGHFQEIGETELVGKNIL